jgi:ATP-dependent Clp protease ATP-binding subunit ClpA
MISNLGYNITFDETVTDFISKVGFDDVYGARPLKRAIQDKVEDLLSEEVLTGKMVEGKTYNIKVDNDEIKISKKGK